MRKTGLIAAAGLGLAGPALAQERGPGEYFGYMHGYGYDGAMLLGPVFMVLLLAILIVGVIAAVRWMAPGPAAAGGGTGDGAGSAMAILNQRLARGEIDAKEYSERKALLGG